MKLRLGLLALVLAFSAGAVTPAMAQDFDDHHVPRYMQWQNAWDRYEFDRHHVILGTVTNFAPFRLQIARRNGEVQMIDLKNGTVILPTGTTPMQGERVAIIGYYSRGTFIANRLIVRG